MNIMPLEVTTTWHFQIPALFIHLFILELLNFIFLCSVLTQLSLDLSIYLLFNERRVSSSGIASDNEMISKQKIGKDVEGSVRGLI
jgi:hypothetical protein